MRVSLAVMAHPSRAHLLPRLLAQLHLDPDRVAWDSGDGNRWNTGRRAWELHDPAATHHVVIQDDAIACRDLRAGLEVALRYVPAECIVSLYTGTRRPSKAKVERAVTLARRRQPPPSWIAMPALNWGVGIVAPVDTIPEMIAYCERQTYPNYDRRVGRFYLEDACYPTWCTWPSLLGHLEVPSIAGHGSGRTAHNFLGEDRSALDVEWSDRVVKLEGYDLADRRFFARRQQRAEVT